MPSLIAQLSELDTEPIEVETTPRSVESLLESIGQGVEDSGLIIGPQMGAPVCVPLCACKTWSCNSCGSGGAS